MKDYKRLTERITASNTGRIVLVIPSFRHEIIEQTNRLADFEDKIESGELCDREAVRKETAREIFRWLAENQDYFTGNIEVTCGDYMEKRKEYGIELFGNSDKLEEQQ